jgi:Fur family iron response transcriptional regulator
VALARILFSRGARHVTAETLYHEAAAARLRVSLATVYNTLRQLTGAGLLREIAAGGSRAFFDTNLSEHHHFFVEGDEAIIDLPPGYVELGGLPDVPPGYEIARVDVVVRLRRRCG